MKRFSRDVIFLFIAATVAVFLFKEPAEAVLKEITWLVTIITLISISLAVYVGWALTKSMNKR